MKENVLIIIPDLRQGGAESALLKICETITSDVNIHILTIKKQGQLVSRFEEICQSVKEITNNKVKFVLYNRYYQKFIGKKHLNNTINALYKGLNFTTIIAFLEGSATFIANNLEFKCANKIAWIHTSIVAHNKITDYSKFNHVICCSNLVASELKTLNIEAQVIYNLIDNEKILEMAKTKVDFSKSEFNIVTVARFDHAKALTRLIKVSKELNSEEIFHHLYIVGYGRLYKKLEKMAKGSNITIINKSSNVYKYMANADLFVLLSLYEGYGMVVDEALLLKRLVLVTNTNSVEAVANGKYGLICENNELAIKTKLQAIIEANSKMEICEKNIFSQNETIIKQIRSLFGL